MQTNTLKSGWRTIRPIIVELLTAWIQVDQFAMEKEEITEVELLDGAVEHVRKASGTRADLANWPTPVQKSIVPAYSMPFKIQSLDRFCRANG